MICDPDPYYRSNCDEYIANEDPIYFIGRITLCKYCAKHDPTLKIASSQRYMILIDFKLIIYSLKHTKISNTSNSTLIFVGDCESFRSYQILDRLIRKRDV